MAPYADADADPSALFTFLQNGSRASVRSENKQWFTLCVLSLLHMLISFITLDGWLVGWYLFVSTGYWLLVVIYFSPLVNCWWQ